MNEVTSHNITYNDIINGVDLGNDKHGLGKLFNQHTKRAFLDNPNLYNFDEIAIYLRKVDGVIGGISMSFPTKIIVDGEVIEATSASTLEVYNDYRKLDIGSELMLEPLTNNNNSFLLIAGLSDMALPIYKILKYKIFEIPRYMKLYNSFPLIASYIKNVYLSKALSIGVNLIASIPNCIYKYKGFVLKKKFLVQRENKVPHWVTDMVKKDSHKYSEFHDQKWFQWNLVNNLHGLNGDRQYFYSIYKEGNPCGFFLFKTRYREEAGGKLHNVTIGSIMEWQTVDETIISESDIYTLALCSMPKVDIVEFVTSNRITAKKMRKICFIQHGNAHIAIKDLKKKYKDITDPSNWRLRFGYADVFLT